jgi:mono/diheme cytochrome c family protein
VSRGASRLLALGLFAVACGRSGGSGAPPAPARWSDAAMLAEGARFLDDASFRRAALVDSLTNPNNTYSRQRLTSYGLASKGWDLLPEWNPRSVTVSRPIADAVASGQRARIGPEVGPLWDGTRPSTMAGWIALGRETFFRYPLRREVVVEWALGHPDVASRTGIRPAADGAYPGVVAFVDTRGESQIGMTCAICHADPDGRHVVVGRARRSFDYGALRLAYSAATGASLDPDLARRMKTWGPGRADVTEDDDEDPVAVPDLWGLRHQTFLTQAGTIKHVGPTALAIRQETQLLTSNHQTVRPPRELAFALAMFLYSLEPPPPSAAPRGDAASAHRGRALFDRRCASCHSNPAGGGDPVSVDRVDTDRALANGGARGTGLYRPAGLVRVGDAGPYFHDGSVASLEDVLSPERATPSFRRGVFGPGPVKGHAYGTELSPSERAELVSYLRTL